MNATAATGIFEMSAEEYHADTFGERPSLSASIASILCSASPAHARAAHPLLNPEHKREEKEHYDVGSVCHAMLLEGVDCVWVVEAENWRTKAAQEVRDEARTLGKIPLLAHTYSDALAMVEAAKEQLAAHGAQPPLFTDGKPEQTLIWEERGVLCRARPDWLRDDYTVIEDWKSTSRSANPEKWSRTLFDYGYDLRADFYLRGLRALTGADAEYRFVVIETAPPFALSVVALGPDVLTIGRKKVDYALELWRRCLQRDEWPGYSQRVAYAELPAYEESRWLEKELREEAA